MCRVNATRAIKGLIFMLCEALEPKGLMIMAHEALHKRLKLVLIMTARYDNTSMLCHAYVISQRKQHIGSVMHKLNPFCAEAVFILKSSSSDV